MNLLRCRLGNTQMPTARPHGCRLELERGYLEPETRNLHQKLSMCVCVCVCVLAAKSGVHVEKLVLHLHVKLSRSFCDRLMAWDIRVTRVEHVLPLGQRCAVAESKIEVQHNYWK